MTSHTPKTRHRLLALLSIVALVALAGCGARAVSHVSPAYAQRKPARIVVLPIRNATGKALAAPASHAYLKGLIERAVFAKPQVPLEPLSSFRRQVHDTLHRKDYQVLPLDIVDARLGQRRAQDILQRPMADAKAWLGADSLLYGTITGWDTRRLKTDNTVMIGVSFKLVDVATQAVLWEGEKPYSRVSVKATQPWHDVRYYISRVVRDVFATLPGS